MPAHSAPYTVWDTYQISKQSPWNFFGWAWDQEKGSFLSCCRGRGVVGRSEAELSALRPPTSSRDQGAMGYKTTIWLWNVGAMVPLFWVLNWRWNLKLFILIHLMEWFFHRLPNSFMVKPKVFLFLLYYIEISGTFCHNYCLFQCSEHGLISKFWFKICGLYFYS